LSCTGLLAAVDLSRATSCAVTKEAGDDRLEGDEAVAIAGDEYKTFVSDNMLVNEGQRRTSWRQKRNLGIEP
jgi:hypothetical protein